MGVDILKHEYVPSHEILPKKDSKELLEKLKIKKEQLPVIVITDPVIKNLNAKSNDIIKIVRHSPTAGETVYYRLVTG